MNRQTALTVELSGPLSDFVTSKVGHDGVYADGSEYVRDLIRRDKERADQECFDRLKAELARAFATADSSYAPLTADDVIERNKR